MNYDGYGFEIFDDEWVFTPENSKEPVQKTMSVEEFMKEHPAAKTIAEHWEKEKPKENTIPDKPKTGMLF